MIIDFHCHAGTGDGMTGPWDTSAPLDKYLRRARRVGITKTVVFSAFHSDYARANEAVARIVGLEPERLIGFAFVNCERDRSRVADLVRRAVQTHGFRGIKIHRADARITREACEAARELGVPILYDPMGELGTVELAASEYPDVKFVIPHLSSFADDWKSQLAFVDQLARVPNLFTDTSGVRRFDLLERAVLRAGAHKILFGTDGPWLHPAVELAKIKALRLPEAEERLILRDNALGLLGLAVRPSHEAEPEVTTAVRRRSAGRAAAVARGR
jgi:uncharacterized protein